MNKQELGEILAKENFKPQVYSLVEENKDEALCLRFADGRWCVYYRERGKKSDIVCFDDENSACEYFLKEMRRDPTAKIGWTSGFTGRETQEEILAIIASQKK